MQSIRFENIKEQSYSMKESLRALKTNIQFCGDDVKVIQIVSSVPDEGKSVVSVNLAISLTESGKSVMLIDADMRKSVLVGRLGARAESSYEIYGLSHYLSGQKKLDDVLYATNIPKLFCVFAGPSVPNATEILEKRYFKELVDFGREHFDYVMIDCAPIGAAIDAAVVARQCDGAIIVISQGEVSFRQVSNAKTQMEASGVRILGAVLNKVKIKKSGHYGYGGYYGGYYANEEGKEDDE